MSKLMHKKIVVAGGSSGIGLATVALLTTMNADVTVISRNNDKLKTVADNHQSVKVIAVDATDRKQLDSFFKQNGTFDHLIVTLSGGKGAGLFKDLNLDELRTGFEAKLFPQLNTVQAALPYLNEHGSITIVTAISSRSRAVGTSGLAAINAGLEAMMPTLAKELKPLRINAVSPGVVDTSWWNFLDEPVKKKTFEEYAKQIPVGRVAQPIDIAESIVFLASNEYITGTVIEVDGGLRL